MLIIIVVAALVLLGSIASFSFLGGWLGVALGVAGLVVDSIFVGVAFGRGFNQPDDSDQGVDEKQIAREKVRELFSHKKRAFNLAGLFWILFVISILATMWNLGGGWQ